MWNAANACTHFEMLLSFSSTLTPRFPSVAFTKVTDPRIESSKRQKWLRKLSDPSGSNGIVSGHEDGACLRESRNSNCATHVVSEDGEGSAVRNNASNIQARWLKAAFSIWWWKGELGNLCTIYTQDDTPTANQSSRTIIKSLQSIWSPDRVLVCKRLNTKISLCTCLVQGECVAHGTHTELADTKAHVTLTIAILQEVTSALHP